MNKKTKLIKAMKPLIIKAMKRIIRLSLFSTIQLSFSRIVFASQKAILPENKLKKEVIFEFAVREKLSGLGILKQSIVEKKKKVFLNSLYKINLENLRHNARCGAILNNGISYINPSNQNLMEKNSLAYIRKFFKLSFLDLAFEFSYVSFIWVGVNSVLRLFANYKPNPKNLRKFDVYFKMKGGQSDSSDFPSILEVEESIKEISIISSVPNSLKLSSQLKDVGMTLGGLKLVLIQSINATVHHMLFLLDLAHWFLSKKYVASSLTLYSMIFQFQQLVLIFRMLDSILVMGFTSSLLGLSTFALQLLFFLMQANSVIDFSTTVPTMKPIDEWLLITNHPLPIAGYLIPNILINNVFEVNHLRVWLIEKIGETRGSATAIVLKFVLDLLTKFNKRIGLHIGLNR